MTLSLSTLFVTKFQFSIFFHYFSPIQVEVSRPWFYFYTRWKRTRFKLLVKTFTVSTFKPNTLINFCRLSILQLIRKKTFVFFISQAYGSYGTPQALFEKVKPKWNKLFVWLFSTLPYNLNKTLNF